MRVALAIAGTVLMFTGILCFAGWKGLSIGGPGAPAVTLTLTGLAIVAVAALRKPVWSALLIFGLSLFTLAPGVLFLVPNLVNNGSGQDAVALFAFAAAVLFGGIGLVLSLIGLVMKTWRS